MLVIHFGCGPADYLDRGDTERLAGYFFLILCAIVFLSSKRVAPMPTLLATSATPAAKEIPDNFDIVTRTTPHICSAAEQVQMGNWPDKRRSTKLCGIELDTHHSGQAAQKGG